MTVVGFVHTPCKCKRKAHSLGDLFDDKYRVRSLVTCCKKESNADNEKNVSLIELAFFLAFTLTFFLFLFLLFFLWFFFPFFFYFKTMSA